MIWIHKSERCSRGANGSKTHRAEQESQEKRTGSRLGRMTMRRQCSVESSLLPVDCVTFQSYTFWRILGDKTQRR